MKRRGATWVTRRGLGGARNNGVPLHYPTPSCHQHDVAQDQDQFPASIRTTNETGIQPWTADHFSFQTLTL